MLWKWGARGLHWHGMQRSGVTTARDLPGHGKLGHQLDLLHYFYLDLMAWVASTAMSRWCCNDFCGPCLAIWVWWGKFGVSSGPWEQSCPYRRQQVLLRRKEGEIGASPRGETQRCTAMNYERVVLTFNKKGWIQQSCADSVHLKTAVLFFCLSLSSGFPLESWSYFFLSFQLHSLVSQELGRWDSSLHSSSLLPSYIDLT